MLFFGLIIRLPTVWAPIEEGHRNAQTATLTAGMIEKGHLRLDPIAPWRGDLEARLTQELPVYNLAVLAIDKLPSISFDGAGRLASLIFWLLSFLALQVLWKHTLPPSARAWANLLFVLAPMNWYLSTAFMPESLLQLLAIAFMIFVIDYARNNDWHLFAGLFFTGLLGLLIKFPSFVHLALFACFIFVDFNGWRSLFRPVFLIAGLFVLICVLGWGAYVNTVNATYFADWAGQENLVGFIRPDVSRISLSYWLPIAGYNVAFIVTAVGVPFVILGLLRMLPRLRNTFRSRIWIYLLLSLLSSWLIWGKGAPAQNYYNLPNLVLFCAAFGSGVIYSKQYLRQNAFSDRTLTLLGIALVTCMVSLAYFGYQFLSQPDRVTVGVARWVSANLPPGAPVLYQPRHAASVMDYQHQSLLSHLTGRRTWIWTRATPRFEKQRALHTANYAIVTKPARLTGNFEKLRIRFKGAPNKPPDALDNKYPQQFTKLFEDSNFAVFVCRNAAEHAFTNEH